MMKWLNNANMTALVILTGIMITWATALRYLLAGIHLHFGKLVLAFDVFTPDGGWLAFCGVVMGVGAGQLIGKRATYKPEAADKQSNEGGPNAG